MESDINRNEVKIMQTTELDCGDLILSWTWQERQELLGRIEQIQQQMELNFSKYFINEKGPEQAGPRKIKE